MLLLGFLFLATQAISLVMQESPLAELPPRIYKYRDWGRPFNRTLLTQGELYFSSPADFNDPFDSRLRVRYDKLPDGELKQLLY